MPQSNLYFIDRAESHQIGAALLKMLMLRNPAPRPSCLRAAGLER